LWDIELAGGAGYVADVKIFVAGASGAIGRSLVPRLLGAGHEVIGMARSEAGAEMVRAAGAESVVADALDTAAVARAVNAAQPEVVVHELTAIPKRVDPRAFGDSFAATNRLRREGTRNLVDAAQAAGVRLFVGQSIAQAYAPVGGWVKTEDDPLYADAPEVFRATFDAVIALEQTIAGARGIDTVVLRYGNFYGPGTSWAADGSNAELVRASLFPVAGGGPAHWSFVHVEDAADATVLAIDRAAPGTYNVCDDEPAPVRDWLPSFADALGAPTPPHTGEPRGDYGRFGMLHARGASNAKARKVLGWRPGHSSWRQGFAASLG
jgi:nucleoside-diphosphate-sugar epimerase